MFRALFAALVRSKEALIVALLSTALAVSPAVAGQVAEVGGAPSDGNRISPSVEARQNDQEEEEPEDEDEEEDEDASEAKQGEGCGWLVGGARGDAHQVLMSAWQGFHQTLKGHMGKSADVDRSQRATLRATIETATVKLVEIRNGAIADLREQAQTFSDSECSALEPPREGALVDEYKQIVDAAIAEMRAVAEGATKELDQLVGAGPATSPSAADRGKPSGAGKPSNAGKPEGKGRPDGAGR